MTDGTCFAVGPTLLQQHWRVPPGRVAEFTSWYDEEHLDDLLAVPGVRSARRFVRHGGFAMSSPSDRDHLVLYEVEDCAFRTPEYRELSVTPSGRTLRTTSGLERVRTVYQKVYPPHGALTGSGVDTSDALPLGAALLHVAMHCTDARRAEFEAWYNEDHLPALAGVDGVLHARRYVASEGAPVPPGHNVNFPYLAIYELASPEVLESAEFREAGRPTAARHVLGDDARAHLQCYRLVVQRAAQTTGTASA